MFFFIMITFSHSVQDVIRYYAKYSVLAASRLHRGQYFSEPSSDQAQGYG
jgi:hypothetical protein